MSAKHAKVHDKGMGGARCGAAGSRSWTTRQAGEGYRTVSACVDRARNSASGATTMTGAAATAFQTLHGARLANHLLYTERGAVCSLSVGGFVRWHGSSAYGRPSEVIRGGSQHGGGNQPPPTTIHASSLVSPLTLASLARCTLRKRSLQCRLMTTVHT